MSDVDRRSLEARIAALGIELQKIQLIDPKDGLSHRPLESDKVTNLHKTPSNVGRPRNLRPYTHSQPIASNPTQLVDRREHTSNWTLVFLSFFCSAVLGSLFAAGMAIASSFNKLWVFEPSPNIYLDRILRTSESTSLTDHFIPYSIDGYWFFIFQTLSGVGALVFLMIGAYLLIRAR